MDLLEHQWQYKKLMYKIIDGIPTKIVDLDVLKFTIDVDTPNGVLVDKNKIINDWTKSDPGQWINEKALKISLHDHFDVVCSEIHFKIIAKLKENDATHFLLKFM